MGVQNDFIGRTDRRQAMDQALSGMGADTESLAYGGGKLGAEIAGALGAGGAWAGSGISPSHVAGFVALMGGSLAAAASIPGGAEPPRIE